MLLYRSGIFPTLTLTSILGVAVITFSSFQCTLSQVTFFSLFSFVISLSLSYLSIFPLCLFQSMAKAWLQSHLPCDNPPSITTITHQHVPSEAC